MYFWQSGKRLATGILQCFIALVLISLVVSAYYNFKFSGLIARDRVVSQTADSTITNANESFRDRSYYLYHSLEQKLQDPQTKYLAAIWAPKAFAARQFTTGMVNYVDELRKKINKEKTDDGLVSRLQKEGVFNQLWPKSPGRMGLPIRRSLTA